ncbi:hypothetical protein FS782_07245 [Agrobacterium vitis]|nr:hypothetical protein [Agrobacterium vitis]
MADVLVEVRRLRFDLDEHGRQKIPIYPSTRQQVWTGFQIVMVNFLDFMLKGKVCSRAIAFKSECEQQFLACLIEFIGWFCYQLDVYRLQNGNATQQREGGTLAGSTPARCALSRSYDLCSFDKGITAIVVMSIFARSPWLKNALC